MKLFIFGYGYTAEACADRLRPKLTSLSVTARSAEKVGGLNAAGMEAFAFDGAEQAASLAARPAPDLVQNLAAADTILVSVPPDAAGDPALRRFPEALAEHARRILYLSTIGVYGDFGGAWIDETTAPKGESDRARRRLLAEEQWLAFGRASGINVQILRLAGIYGPGRNPLCDLANGTARRLFKKEQVFNRIHVADIALVAEAALRRAEPGGVWNVSDDEPAPPQDVVAYAASLLGVEPPPLIDYETAALSEMARAFYSENKRVSNRGIREELKVSLQYPTYREGLAALLAAGEGRSGGPSRRMKDVSRGR